jgi:hypothetical protein
MYCKRMINNSLQTCWKYNNYTPLRWPHPGHLRRGEGEVENATSPKFVLVIFKVLVHSKLSIHVIKIG